MKSKLISMLAASMVLCGCGAGGNASSEYTHKLVQNESVRVKSVFSSRSTNFFFKIGSNVYGDANSYPIVSECVFKRTSQQLFFTCVISRIDFTVGGTASASETSSSKNVTTSREVYIFNDNVEYFCSFAAE